MNEWTPTVGEAVLYRPHGQRHRSERGVVTRLSNNPTIAFVRYEQQDPAAPGKATYISDLLPATEDLDG